MGRYTIAAVGVIVAACVSPAASPTASPIPTTAAPSLPATLSPSPSPLSATPTATPIALPSFAQISAPTAGVAWTVVGGTRLFVSSDRGATWQERGVPRRGLSYVGVSFVSDRTGWIMSTGLTSECASVQMWRTIDGAATWTELQPTGVSAGKCGGTLSFVSDSVGYLSPYSPINAATVLQTRDGGKTWAATTLPAPPGASSSVDVQAGRAQAVGTAVFVEAVSGGTPKRHVYVWQSNAPGWAYESTVPNAQDAFAFAGTRRLLIAPAGGSQESTDGGTTWHPYTTDYSQAAPFAPAVVFADGSVGYATVRGQIQRTTDGGAHWTQIETPGTSSP